MFTKAEDKVESLLPNTSTGHPNAGIEKKPSNDAIHPGNICYYYIY